MYLHVVINNYYIYDKKFDLNTYKYTFLKIKSILIE